MWLLPKALSDSAAETTISYLWDRSKKQKPTLGIVCVVHTFGRDLKWNPHVHALVSEGALKKDKEWKVITFFHYEMLRKRWQHVLLKNLGVESKNKTYKSGPACKVGFILRLHRKNISTGIKCRKILKIGFWPEIYLPLIPRVLK